VERAGWVRGNVVSSLAGRQIFTLVFWFRRRVMYAKKKAIENAHIVRERDRERFRELLAVLLLAAPVALFLLLFTWQNLEVIRLARRATELRAAREELVERNRDLRLRIQRMTALGEVEKKAVQLGLHPTHSTHLVNVRIPDGASR
jgi:hypothetical protein